MAATPGIEGEPLAGHIGRTSWPSASSSQYQNTSCNLVHCFPDGAYGSMRRSAMYRSRSSRESFTFVGPNRTNGGPTLEHLQLRRALGACPRSAAASLVVSNPCIFVI